MLVALTSAKGSPGVTSAALALTAVWGRPVVLVEADPAGADLAFRCRAAYGGAVYASKGLVTLAAAARGGAPDPDVLGRHAEMLAGGVRLLQGISSPGQARALLGLWRAIAHAFCESADDVVVDLGRLEASSATMPIAQAADVVLPVAKASLESVMHLRENLTELLPQVCKGEDERVLPLLIGPDASAENDCADLDELLARAGRPVMASLPLAHDPRALVRLEAGERAGGRVGRTMLLRRARHIVQTLQLMDSDATTPGRLGSAPDHHSESSQRTGGVER